MAASLIVPDLVGGERLARCHRSQRHLDQNDEEAVWMVEDRLAAEVDSLLATAPQTPALSVVEGPPGATGSCGCGQPGPEGSLSIHGTPVVINGLPLIFEHLAKRGLEPGAASGETLLKTVRIYHVIETGADEAYRTALVAAYEAFCLRRSRRDAGA